MILYLTSQQHTNLLDFLTEQTDALPIKKMTGNFMLKQFVIYDMRNFSHCTELVLDRDAFGDDDIHFAEAIEEFLTMYNARITVICEGLQESAPLCHDLLEAGVGNIVTAEEIGAIQNEIRQSLSGQGMTRYKPKERTKPQEKEKLYQFATEGVRITMVSSQSRIGTTTMALGLTAWLGSVGASVAYVEHNSSGMIPYLSEAYEIRGKFEFTISSTENDVFMSETDYVNLRSILDLKPIMLADDEYILQCTSSNVEALELYVQKKPNLKIGNSYYRIRNIYSENFMQQEAKGNGEGVLIVVPDNVINDLSFYMNVLAVKTKSNLSLVEINNMKNIDDKSYIVSKAGVRSQSASMAIYAVVPLFYLAIVIIAMICTVLSIQILSEAKKDIRSCKILTYLGMEEKEYKKILKKQLAILYFLPAVPAMLINVIIFPISVSGTVRKANGMLHIVGVWQGMKQLGITIIIFVLFLFLYYFVTYKLYLKICNKECVQ